MTISSHTPLVTTGASIDHDAVAGLLQHTVVRASAGSGKTYQLTNRVLQLLLLGAPVHSILATTFTRKAAGEIRDRIFQRLLEAAGDESERCKLTKTLEIGRLSQERLASAAVELARHAHRLNICTLDSFFAGIVQSFARELGAPSPVRILEEHEQHVLRSEALRATLNESDTQSTVELLRQLLMGDVGRSVTESMEHVVKELHEVWCETDTAAWRTIDEQAQMSESQLVDAIDYLSTREPGSDKRLNKAQAAANAYVLARDWETFVSKGLGHSIAACGESAAPQYYRKDIPDEVVAAYQPLVDHATAVLTNRVRAKTLATDQLLTMYHDALMRLKQQRGLMSFGDLVGYVVNAESLGKMEDICYRLDGRIDHVLFDEFQDTSVQQWRGLRALVGELVSNAPPDKSLFVVGDVKQSLYGWRGGAPDLLLELPKLLFPDDHSGPLGQDADAHGPAITQLPLAASRRSSQVIMDVVNEVFGDIAANPELRDHRDAGEQWLRGFDHHETEVELTGYAQLRMTRATEKNEPKLPLRVAATAKLVADVHDRAPGATIGILCRSNKVVGEVLHAIKSQRPDIICSEVGGQPLTDTPAVNAILSALHLARHPGDGGAAFHVTQSPLIDVLGAAARHDGQQIGAINGPSLSRAIRQMLGRDGLAECIGRWVGAIMDHVDSREARRLLQLAEHAVRFEQAGPGGTVAFVQMIETNKVADTTPASVEVMTIHQAKGLEFDCVILPQLDEPLGFGNKTPDLVGSKARVDAGFDAVSRFAKKDILPLMPQHVQQMHADALQRHVSESLSTLYVAMTRAKHALYMVINHVDPGNSGKKLKPTMARVLHAALVDEANISLSGADDDPSIVYEHGDSDWTSEPRFQRCAESDASDERQVETNGTEVRAANRMFTPPPAAIGLARGRVATPASASSPGDAAMTRTLASVMQLSDRQALDRGTVMHVLFEQVRWLDDAGDDHASLDDEHLTAAVRCALPRAEDAWIGERITAFRDALGAAEIRDALSLGDQDASLVRIERELPIARLMDDGATQWSEIDRLQLHFDRDGAVVSACVLDFKTDAIDADDLERSLAERAEHHRGQIEVYREVVAQRYALETAQVSAQLVFVSAGRVVEV